VLSRKYKEIEKKGYWVVLAMEYWRESRGMVKKSLGDVRHNIKYMINNSNIKYNINNSNNSNNINNSNICNNSNKENIKGIPYCYHSNHFHD
jgi:hypothetical protein